jgi:general secretion pathway protein F/type IV pilus assembly protein PilC
MPEFTYIARNTAGQKVSGSVTAAGRREALAAIGARSLFPLDVRSDAPVADKPSRVRRVPAQLLATTYGQLADLLHSGVPLLRALEVLQKQTSHGSLKRILDEVHHQVEDGATLAQAMSRFQRVFGDMAVSMIRAGGEGGFLEEALTRVAQFTESQEDLKKRTIGAIVYPAFLAVVGTIIVNVLIIFFVPKFAELFAKLRERGELPWITDALLWTSAKMRLWGPLVLVALVVGAWLLVRWMQTEAGKLFWDRFKLHIPAAGVIFRQLAVARFCRVLGTLLKNGVPIIRSLGIASDATANRVLSVAIQDATENISAGQSLAQPLGASGQFPVTVVEMIAVAEQANTLETVLLDISDGLERRTWRRLDLVVRMLEPVLLLLIAGMVLVVVIALLLPVLKMSTTI